MRNLFAKSLLLTPIVLGVMWAGAARAQDTAPYRSQLPQSPPRRSLFEQLFGTQR